MIQAEYPELYEFGQLEWRWPVRVLLFSQQLRSFRSGVGTYAKNLVKGLAHAGCSLTVVGPRAEACDIEGIEVRPVDVRAPDPTPGKWVALGLRFAQRWVWYSNPR